MKNLTRIFTTLVLLLSFTFTTWAAGFTDLDKGDHHYVPILYVQEEGIIDGYPDGSFKAWQTVNRAEALKMITIACGIYDDIEDVDEDTEDPFTDTPIAEWYTKYLVAAKDKGIIEGYSDGSFKPGQTVNLVESLKMYVECFDNIIYPTQDEYLFADTPPEAWFTKYTMYSAQRMMLIINLENEIFPDQDMDRGYLAEVIFRHKKFGEGFKFGKATYYGGRFEGEGTASGDVYRSSGLTAAHRTLPFNTLVEATNLANGESVTVRINDRGPWGAGRELDLSSTAFEQIGSLSTGVIDVQYKVVTE